MKKIWWWPGWWWGWWWKMPKVWGQNVVWGAFAAVWYQRRYGHEDAYRNYDDVKDDFDDDDEDDGNDKKFEDSTLLVVQLAPEGTFDARSKLGMIIDWYHNHQDDEDYDYDDDNGLAVVVFGFCWSFLKYHAPQAFWGNISNQQWMEIGSSFHL